MNFAKGCRHQDDDQQRQGVDNASHRGACTAFDIRRRPRDGAGGGNAAKERADNIGQSLRDELLIRVVPVVDHAVRHHGAEERFDGSEEGNG